MIFCDSERCANRYFFRATASPSRIGRIVVWKSVRVVKVTIKFEDGFRGRFLRILFGNPSAPKHVVSNEQSTFAQPRSHQPQHTRIVFLIDIVEDDVEFGLLLRENFQRVAGVEGDTVRNSCTSEITPSSFGVF